MKYIGSCHCGGVRFEVDGELTGGMTCNCSICHRRASALWFVGLDQLRVLTSEDQLATYTCNKHVIKHRFCKTCGIHPFGEGTAPDGKAMAAISINCLDDVDMAAIPIQAYDGRSK